MGRWLALLSFLALGLAACGTTKTTQTVTGHLVEEGGMSSVQSPVPGNIEIIGGTHTYSTTAGWNGTFSLEVPAGTYQAQGRPAIKGLSGYPCVSQPFTLKAGTAIHTTVICAVP